MYAFGLLISTEALCCCRSRVSVVFTPNVSKVHESLYTMRTASRARNRLSLVCCGFPFTAPGEISATILMRPKLHESADSANILDGIRFNSRTFVTAFRTPAASQEKRRGRLHALIQIPEGRPASTGRRDREETHQVPSGMRRNTPRAPPFLMGCLRQIALRYLHSTHFLTPIGSWVVCRIELRRLIFTSRSYRKEPIHKSQIAITSLDQRYVNTCEELTPAIGTGGLRKLENLTPSPLNTEVQGTARV